MVPVDNNSFVSDIKQLIEQSRRTAYAAVNSIMIDTYWHIGQRIVEQEQQGEKRAELEKGGVNVPYGIVNHSSLRSMT